MSDCYEGTAIVKEVEFGDLPEWAAKDLTEEDKNSAMNIKLSVELENETHDMETIMLEVSNRPGFGRMSGKTQAQLTLDSLRKNNLLDNDDLNSLMSKVGSKVNVYQKDSVKNEKVYRNTYLGSGFHKIDEETVRKRMAMLFGSKVSTPVETKANPFLKK